MLKKGFYLEEIDKKNKALLCIDYMLEAIFNKDYETAEIEAKEFLAVIEMLKEIEAKKNVVQSLSNQLARCRNEE